MLDSRNLWQFLKYQNVILFHIFFLKFKESDTNPKDCSASSAGESSGTSIPNQDPKLTVGICAFCDAVILISVIALVIEYC